MSQLIDLCGKAVRLEDIQYPEIGHRRYVFCPCFVEISSQNTSKGLFRNKAVTISRFKYIGTYPYGAVLSDREKPSINDKYAIKSDAGFIVNKIIDKATAPIGNAARLVARNLGIDTSINKDMRIWSRGQTFEVTKWGNLPAKIRYLDGREVDVYPNSAEYKELDDTITPTTKDVPTLEVHMKNNTTLVFFGGIDIPDVNAPYQALLNTLNLLNASKDKKKKNVFAAPGSSREKKSLDNMANNQLPPASIPVQIPQTEKETIIEKPDNKTDL